MELIPQLPHTLIHKAIGDRLYGIFVDNGVLRKDEFENVLTTYAKLGLNVKGIDARQRFIMTCR